MQTQWDETKWKPYIEGKSNEKQKGKEKLECKKQARKKKQKTTKDVWMNSIDKRRREKRMNEINYLTSSQTFRFRTFFVAFFSSWWNITPKWYSRCSQTYAKITSNLFNAIIKKNIQMYMKNEWTDERSVGKETTLTTAGTTELKSL